MSLPKLLRGLSQSVSSRDSRGVRDTLAELGRHDGWAGDVAGFLAGLRGSDAAYVASITNKSTPAPALLGGGRAASGGGYQPGAIFGPRGYPTTALAMATTVGYGTWSAGWLCDEASGSLVPAFGSPSLTPVGTPTYASAGPLGGVDKAVGANSNDDAFTGGNVFDAVGTDDVALLWVGFHSTTPTSSLMSKYDGGSGKGYYIDIAAGGELRFSTEDPAATRATTAGVTPVGSWYVGCGVIDRGAGKIRVAYRTLAGAASISTETTIAANTLTNAFSFFLMASTWLSGPTDMLCAALYVAKGSGAATGLSANLATGIASFRGALIL